ncbi:MAG: glycosyltransferase family 4 protein [Candidatus Portnoybacteria bacterium CG10_big_fil_rev_8_21_14_0_10_38_18]|uniref:Glycosyltransferase family 4 protein n=1 Tax=Candidatus Portnoybacteria bacterium CG10_big_fil_rev_8_21_14_0_10_38_18 TaxID=1974813 RepID=A0A2M8KC07_9BACT|nr:MAG: glycosyltransferase family 4 protein [Candidatus Portnoybacteria bacterium CG10_big_fil_rev_8_21_14_0_10_38_18]
MKIALIHDYLVAYGGAEKVFKVLADIFPEAEIYTLFYDPKIKKQFFPNKIVHTSFLQKFPLFLRKKYQMLLPLLPIAVETMDFREFDVVISATHSFAKGIITRPKTTHICYCYSPTRYLWDKARRNFLLHYFRVWDRQASERVDHFIAVSKTVQQRIKKYYKRESIVIYPPVEIHPVIRQGAPSNDGANSNREYYLIVSQLRKYKRIDLAVEAFNKLGLELVIIGEGPEKRELKAKTEKNIRFLGWQPDETVAEYYRDCTAFIFPSEDDFGIAPVEAMSWGKPVLAFRKGGATETIIEGKTGEFFDYQNAAVLADGIRRLRQNLKNYDPKFISQHAQKFSRERFEKEFKNIIDKLIKV